MLTDRGWGRAQAVRSGPLGRRRLLVVGDDDVGRGRDCRAAAGQLRDVDEHLRNLQRAADATHAITRHRTVESTMQETVDQVRAVVGAHQAVVSLTVSGEQATSCGATGRTGATRE